METHIDEIAKCDCIMQTVTKSIFENMICERWLQCSLKLQANVAKVLKHNSNCYN